jgi:NAD(P)-dependent dehydrogenase (short-subunit alcohol dehydrogenase family)
LSGESGESSEFAGRVALVTGAAGGGIGESVARRLAAGGASVVVTDVHERRTREVTAKIAADHPGVAVAGYRLDASDRAGIDEVVAAVARSLGPVRILVNNAAINIVGSIFDYDPKDWDRCVAVNLSGPWYLCRVVMPIMRDAGGGSIVNVSSYAPDVGGGGVEAPYAVTKGGLNALTRSCAVEGGPHGIRVNAVSMGVVTGTRFIDQNPGIAERLLPATPLGRHATTADIAEAVAFLASERAKHITGEILNVAGGIYMRS